VKPITLLCDGATILVAMLFLAAFSRLWMPRETEPSVALGSRAALGHLGLTIIALVFVLLTFWKG
jgi:hypothetical protein